LLLLRLEVVAALVFLIVCYLVGCEELIKFLTVFFDIIPIIETVKPVWDIKALRVGKFYVVLHRSLIFVEYARVC
jgi:hypothetical protein